MTRIAPSVPAPSRSRSGLIDLQFLTNAGDVFADLSLIPTVVHAAVKARGLDLFSHHRRRVMSRHRMPRRAGGRKLIASLSRYYVDESRGTFDLDGEGFIHHGELGRGAIRLLEEGGSVVSDGAMTIPAGAGTRSNRGVRGTKGSAAFKRLVGFGDGDDLRFVPLGNGMGLLVRELKARKDKRAPTGRIGERSQVIAVLTRRRAQTAQLGWFDQWDDVLPKHQRRLDKDLELALDEVGGRKVKRRLVEITEAEISRNARRPWSGGRLPHPSRGGEARGASVRVGRAVRSRNRLSNRGGGS